MKYNIFNKALLSVMALITVILQLIVLEYSNLTYKYADYLVISSAINITVFTMYCSDLLSVIITGDRPKD